MAKRDWLPPGVHRTRLQTIEGDTTYRIDDHALWRARVEHALAGREWPNLFSTLAQYALLASEQRLSREGYRSGAELAALVSERLTELYGPPPPEPRPVRSRMHA
jgi:hypothetical protein